MKARILIPALVLIAIQSTQVLADDGATLFRNNCGACHTVGKGKLVGPDLKDVQNRHAESWLHKWIKSSQSLVQAGDKDAVKLFADNGSMPMPDQALSDDEIKTVLAYIGSGGDQPATIATVAPSPKVESDKAPPTPQIITQGSRYSVISMFKLSVVNYMLMALVGLLFIVVWIMGTAIKSLSEKVNTEELKK